MRTGVWRCLGHYSGYFKGFRNASKLRHLLMQENEQRGVREVLLNFNPDASDLQLRTASLEGRTKIEGIPSQGDRSVGTKKPAPPPALA